MVKKITVFCASSTKIPEIYFQTAHKLAQEFLLRNITLVYGGGSVGLMGELATTILKGNGKVIGIIPQFMIEKEWGNGDASELVVVKNMQERKQKLIEETDAIVVLPGGCGTLDELFEAITLKQLGQFTKPIVIINTNGFYNPLIELLDKIVKENFMREMHKKMWTVVNEPGEVISAINNAEDWGRDNIHFAAV